MTDVPLIRIVRRIRTRTLLAGLVATLAWPTVAWVLPDNHPDLTGIYKLVLAETDLPRGLKNTGMLMDLPLQPDASGVAKTRNLKEDPAKLCKDIGPFRMMARDGTKIELLPSEGNITMLFEDVALGHMRVFHLARPHPAKIEPTWMGDSIGHWEGNTLVADTIGFNDITWLSDDGAPHSDALHLTERYRLVDDGKYLEIKVTAEDPKVLTKPFSYTRYYRKSNSEIVEEFCQESE